MNSKILCKTQKCIKMHNGYVDFIFLKRYNKSVGAVETAPYLFYSPFAGEMTLPMFQVLAARLAASRRCSSLL